MPVTSIHERMRRVLLSDSGAVLAYLDPHNSHDLMGVARTIKGVAKSTSTTHALQDPGKFSGVVPGQYVWNKTKDTYHEVTSATANALTLRPHIRSMGNRWGVADSTVASQLVDNSTDFDTLGTQVGMVAYNRSTGQSALVTGVSTNALQLSANIFSTGQKWALLDRNFVAGDEYEVCTAVLNGNAGQVMVEIPKFYFRYQFVAPGNHRWFVSEKPAIGYQIHPAFTPGGREVDKIYVAAFEGTIDTFGTDLNQLTAYTLGSTKLKSVAGLQPVSFGQRSEFRQVSRNRGKGWQQQDWYTLWAIQLLFLIEFETTNSDTLSEGATTWSSAEWTDYNAQYAQNITGWSLRNGNKSADGRLNARHVGAYMSYRGIENFFGNLWKWTDGINITDTRVWLCNDPAVYQDDLFEFPFLDTGVNQRNSSGYISKVSQSPHGLLVETSSGASATFIPDYYFYAAGVRVVRSGGSLNNGDQAGFATLNANNTSSNRNSNSGGRVCFSDSDFSALPLGKTHNRPQGVSRHAESSGQKSKHN